MACGPRRPAVISGRDRPGESSGQRATKRLAITSAVRGYRRVHSRDGERPGGTCVPSTLRATGRRRQADARSAHVVNERFRSRDRCRRLPFRLHPRHRRPARERQTWAGSSARRRRSRRELQVRSYCLVRPITRPPPEFWDRLSPRSPRPNRIRSETAPGRPDMLPAAGQRGQLAAIVSEEPPRTMVLGQTGGDGGRRHSRRRWPRWSSHRIRRPRGLVPVEDPDEETGANRRSGLRKTHSQNSIPP